MKDKIKFEWELIFRTQDRITNTWRAKVPGGWIVKDFNCIYVDNFKTSEDGVRDYTMSVTMQFISDPQHKWDIEVIEVMV